MALLYLFHRNLHLKDYPSLVKATSLKKPVVCAYVFDERIEAKKWKAQNWWLFKSLWERL